MMMKLSIVGQGNDFSVESHWKSRDARPVPKLSHFQEVFMKALHLLVVVLFTFTLCLNAVSGNVLAATDKKEVAAPVDKAEAPLKVAPNAPNDKGGAVKATKGIPKDVNINTADKDTLVLLPGVGPATAEAILTYRKDNGNFKSVDELVKVKGIGDKSLAKLKPYLQTL